VEPQSNIEPAPPEARANTIFGRQKPATLVALFVAGGLVAAGGAAWLLVALANLFDDKTLIARTDDAVTTWFTLQGSDAFDRIFRAISLLGGWGLLVIVIAVVIVLLRRRQTRRAAAIVVAGAGAFTLNTFLRVSFERAHSVSATTLTSAAQSWNFPSGQALNALVVYGFMAYLLLEVARPRARVGISVAAPLLVILIGFTRIYLGVHTLSEVTTGYVAGAVWLAACVAAYRSAPGLARSNDSSGVRAVAEV